MQRKRLQRFTRILPHRFAAPPNTVPRKTRVFAQVSRVKRILTGVTGPPSRSSLDHRTPVKSRPVSRIRKTLSKTHPLPLSEREKLHDAPRAPSLALHLPSWTGLPLLFSCTFALLCLFFFFGVSAPRLSHFLSHSSSPSLFLFFSRRVRTYLRNAVVRVRQWRFGLTNSGGAEGKIVSWPGRRITSILDRAIHNTRSRVRGASVTRDDTCVRLSRSLSPFSARRLACACSLSRECVVKCRDRLSSS